MDRIEIGKIINTVGLKGEIKVQPLTSDINRFKKLKTFYIDDNKYECDKASIRNDKVALKIKNFDSIESVEKFKNKSIYVDRKDAIELKKDEYFAVDLMGLEIYYNEKKLGTVTEIANYGASDIIFFKSAGVEKSFVVIDDIIKNVDFISKKIFVTDKILDVICE